MKNHPTTESPKSFIQKDPSCTIPRWSIHGNKTLLNTKDHLNTSACSRFSIVHKGEMTHLRHRPCYPKNQIFKQIQLSRLYLVLCYSMPIDC
mmetsp:Transcript_1596/g.5505  ORF Transcript_1596/g.5505 Transcript_1596/m.5505 type:complete len:92 (-) Transcript_1596:1437-1712(-)